MRPGVDILEYNAFEVTARDPIEIIKHVIAMLG
jgi:hypothetical protein